MRVSSEDPSLTPPSNAPWTALRGLVRRGGRVFGVVLLAFVGFVLIKSMMEPYGLFNIDAGFLFAVVLVAAGLLLLRGQESAVAAATLRPRKPRSPLGVLTLSAAFCVCGVMILLGNLGIASVGIPQIAATGLFVLGAGLLVGAWWGRARLLIPIGILLVPIVALTAFIQFPLRGSVGDTHLTAGNMDEVDDSYEILVGTFSLDLLQVDEFPQRSQIGFDVAAGRVTIFVPQRVALTVNGRIEWGNATIGHGPEQGEDLRFENELPGAPGAGHLEINFRGGIASLYVERISHRELYGRSRASERAEQRRAEQEAARERREARQEDRGRDSTRQERRRRQRMHDDG